MVAQSMSDTVSATNFKTALVSVGIVCDDLDEDEEYSYRLSGPVSEG